VLAGGSAARAPQLVLPYDLAARGSVVYVADGGRHQLLRLDLRRRRLSVVAGTGQPGATGDGGPAVRARIGEPTELVLDAGGAIYFTDVSEGRVRRVDRHGVISTVARVAGAAGLALDPTGRYLAVASIDGWVYRITLSTPKLEVIAGDGSNASSGDGGPAQAAKLTRPHDVTFDADGNLLIAELADVRRIDAASGTIETAFRRCAFKVVPGPRGTLFLIDGTPRGGTITQIDAAGRALRRIGTGRLSAHRDTAPAARVGFLPSDVEMVAGALLISQTEPVAALRRLGSGSSLLRTLLR
jgi:sugar lactone lactonase YvrE